MIVALVLRTNGDNHDLLLFIKKHAEAVINEKLTMADVDIARQIDLKEEDLLRRIWRRHSENIIAWNMADLCLFPYTLVLLICIVMGDRVDKMVRGQDFFLDNTYKCLICVIFQHFMMCIPFAVILLLAGSLRVKAIESLEYALKFHHHVGKHSYLVSATKDQVFLFKWMAGLETLLGLLVFVNMVGLVALFACSDDISWRNPACNFSVPYLILIGVETVLPLLNLMTVFS